MFLSFCGKVPRNEGAAFVAPNATVQGDVILKAGSTVWYGAVLRGDDGQLIIGENSNVQDNAVLHCDVGGAVTLGRNVTAQPLCRGQKLHHRRGCTGAGGHGHPGRLGGRGRARKGHQAGEPRTGRGQPAQRRPLCGARQSARSTVQNGLTPVFSHGILYKKPLFWGRR